jgi:hypothetical protein
MIWNLPNKLTVSRMLMVPLFVLFLLLENGENTGFRILALCLFCIASITDYLDGKIARTCHLVTNFGKFMDPLADKLLVCSALISMISLSLLPAWVVLIVVAREFIISGFRLVAAEQGIVIAASMWGKSKTVSQMACIIALLLPVTTYWWGGVCRFLTVLMTVLTVISLLDYLCKNRKVLEERTE